jgi:hypothetical protein
MNTETTTFIEALEKKFEAINQKTETHLRRITLVKTNYLLGLYSNGCC